MADRSYRVLVVDDDELPPDQNWAFIRCPESLCFVVKHSQASSPKTLAEAWAAYRAIVSERHIRVVA